MRPGRTQRGILSLTLITVSHLCGCATVGVPVLPRHDGTDFSFEAGWGSQPFDRGPEEVRAATLEALADLQMRSVHQDRSGTTWLLDARTDDGRHVRVAIQPRLGATGSVVSARVGRLGDPSFSRTLTDRVGVRLGTLPPQAIPAEPPQSSNPGRFSRDAVPDAVMFGSQLRSAYQDGPIP